MTEPEHEDKENPQDFLADLDTPIYDVVEKGKDQSGVETRDLDE